MERIKVDTIILFLSRIYTEKICNNYPVSKFIELTSRLDRGHNTDVVYFNFEKAFIQVSFRMLLYILEPYGIRGKGYLRVELEIDSHSANEC